MNEVSGKRAIVSSGRTKIGLARSWSVRCCTVMEQGRWNRSTRLFTLMEQGRWSRSMGHWALKEQGQCK